MSSKPPARQHLSIKIAVVSVCAFASFNAAAVASEPPLSSEPPSSSELGNSVSIVDDNPYDSWQTISKERDADPSETYESGSAWTIQARKPAPVQNSFGDPTLDSIYQFVEGLPFQLDGFSGASIPDLLQAEW